VALWLVRPEAASSPAAAPSIEDLIAPLTIGSVVARGYALSPPRRGEEHDVVLTARRIEGDGPKVELHILDKGRWSGIRETRSFGIAYEAPRSAATKEDCEAVTEALASAVRANDAGQWGPVDTIRLRSEPPPPWMARAMDRLSGARGIAVGVCLVVATWAAASAPLGAVWAGLWLLVLGLSLRLPHLDLPFVRDQDVQRLFTGHLPLGQIMTGIGVTDRHPPFYFLVLHVAQLFGQSEAVVRTPAALAGALVGPVIVWAAYVLKQRLDVAALAGLAATISVELVARSREVSPIPLFALLAVGMSVSLLRHRETPTRRWAVAVAATHGLALWTYYIAIFAIAGELLVLLALGRLPRKTLRAAAVGVGLGLPALGLGIATFFRDRGARLAAEAQPGLAWGDRGFLEIAGFLGTSATSAFGPVLLSVFLLGAIRGAARRDAAPVVPMGAALLSFVGIAALAPLARVQPYYLMAVLPLCAVSGAVALGGLSRRVENAATATMAVLLIAFSVPRMHELRGQYIADTDAFMPGFAAAILDSPEPRIVTVAHYDATLLTYYLARARGRAVDWRSLQPLADGAYRVEGVDKEVEPLVYSHSPGVDPGHAAANVLDQRIRAGAVLVVERDSFRLEPVLELLRHCRRLAEVGSGRLWRCSATR